MANLSQQKRQRMLEFLQTIREQHKDDDDVLTAIGEIESEDGQIMEQRVISHRRLNGCVGETLYLKSINNEYKLDIQQ